MVATSKTVVIDADISITTETCADEVLNKIVIPYLESFQCVP